MIKLILKVANWVLSPILSVLNFPVVPAGLASIVSQIFGYMEMGMGIINFFVPLNLIKPLIDIFVACYLVEHGYHLVMWVLKKIPMLGISE